MLDEELNQLKYLIRKRSENLNADWTPFIQNVEDILEHIKLLSMEIDKCMNMIGETTGMIKNLRKILIKLEVIDDRFIF